MESFQPGSTLTFRRILRTWWPLAASWLLMGAELPVLSAVVARLADPEINLAAYGGVVFPLALIIESPIIMLLAASTALSKDWQAYRTVWRFMMVTSAALTVLHVLIAYTPLYDALVVRLLQIPGEIVEPARLGLKIMIPWTWSIAYRRFNQGILIRFGRSQAVGAGTVVRLTTDGVVLAAGYLLAAGQASPPFPGVAVATTAVAAGVVAEASYSAYAARPVIRGELRLAPVSGEPLSLRSFLSFYIPLAMTSLIQLLANPIGSAALSRMPEAIASLATWPVLTGLIFMVRSAGTAYNEVVVALLEKPGSSGRLKQFAAVMAAATTGLVLLLAATPLAGLWFSGVSALPPHLTQMARAGLWIALPLPALTVYLSWYQGAILYGRRTRGVTESVVIYLLASAVTLSAGVLWGRTAGLYVGLLSLVISTIAQTSWLWLRSRPARRAVQARDQAGGELPGLDASVSPDP